MIKMFCLNKVALVLVSSFVVFVLTAFPAFAQVNSYGNSLKDSVEKVAPAPSDINRENLQNTVREAVKEQKGVWLQKTAEVRSQVMEKLRFRGGAVILRYKAVISRYETLISRIEKRVELEKAQGRDTSAVEASLSKVKADVDKIKPSVDLAVFRLEAINENSSAEEIHAVVKEVKDILKAEKENLVTLKQSIRKLIADVHALSLENKAVNGISN